MSLHGERPKSDKPKLSSKHPIACIEKRVIDSESFAHLPPSAVVVLLLLARNLEKGRNGHVFVAASDAVRHGINEKTLYRQIKLLVAHGFLCQTKRGGNGVCSRYALTWLSLSKDTKGIHVDHFQPAAWRNWVPVDRKNAPVKMSSATRQKYRFAPDLADKNTVRVPDKNTGVECDTNTQFNERGLRACSLPESDRLTAYLAKLTEARFGGGQHAGRIRAHLTRIGGRTLQ